MTGPARLPACIKPPYAIPSVAEIKAMPRLGMTAASTFVGGGGSDCGIEWAGFDVKWANEFDAMARESYRANWPGHYLDGRDIREVTGADVLSASGLVERELDLFNGSPPCQAFSMAGKRERDWGDKAIGLDKGRRKDDLFFEFARLVKEIQPRAFMAENVKGLVTGSAKGYFVEIHRELSAAGYRVAAKVIDAQWLGVPQSRQRLIFIGFRSDMGIDPKMHFPAPFPYRYTVRDACPHAVMMQSGSFGREWRGVDVPSGTIVVEDGGTGKWGKRQIEDAEGRRKLTIPELRRLCGFPDDYQLIGPYAEQWKRLGNAVPPPMAMAIASGIGRALVAHDAGV